MPTTITATEVVSQFGAYYIDAGQNEGNIHKRLRESFGTRDAFTVIDTDQTQLNESNTTFTEVLQSFQTTFTPKGGVTFKPKTIQLYNVKVDQSFYPDALKNSWLQFLVSNNLDRTTWPFVRWFIEEYVMGQIQHDLEMQAIYSAVYSAPEAGTANAANQVMNGVKKIINDAIDAAKINTIATGAPNATNSTWAGQIETFVQGVPELYWNLPIPLNMSRGLALRYKQGRRTKYNSNYAQVSEAMAVQDFESIQVTGRGSMTGSNKIWMTPKGNAILGFNGGGNQNIVKVETEKRMVNVFTDFWIGLGFIDDGLVWTNDQDLNPES